MLRNVLSVSPLRRDELLCELVTSLAWRLWCDELKIHSSHCNALYSSALYAFVTSDEFLSKLFVYALFRQRSFGKRTFLGSYFIGKRSFLGLIFI